MKKWSALLVLPAHTAVDSKPVYKSHLVPRELTFKASLRNQMVPLHPESGFGERCAVDRAVRVRRNGEKDLSGYSPRVSSCPRWFL